MLSFHSWEQQKRFTNQTVFAEKDVNRTDRTTSFYEGVDNPRLGLLHDILMTYCMYDFDLGEAPPSTPDQSLGRLVFQLDGHCFCPPLDVLPLPCVTSSCPSFGPSGYVQGMSDLLSPILCVMDNEVEAFWCFVSFMDQMVSSG